MNGSSSATPAPAVNGNNCFQVHCYTKPLTLGTLGDQVPPLASFVATPLRVTNVALRAGARKMQAILQERNLPIIEDNISQTTTALSNYKQLKQKLQTEGEQLAKDKATKKTELAQLCTERSEATNSSQLAVTNEDYARSEELSDKATKLSQKISTLSKELLNLDTKLTNTQKSHEALCQAIPPLERQLIDLEATRKTILADRQKQAAQAASNTLEETQNLHAFATFIGSLPDCPELVVFATPNVPQLQSQPQQPAPLPQPRRLSPPQQQQPQQLTPPLETSRKRPREENSNSASSNNAETERPGKIQKTDSSPQSQTSAKTEAPMDQSADAPPKSPAQPIPAANASSNSNPSGKPPSASPSPQAQEPRDIPLNWSTPLSNSNAHPKTDLDNPRKLPNANLFKEDSLHHQVLSGKLNAQALQEILEKQQKALQETVKGWNPMQLLVMMGNAELVVKLLSFKPLPPLECHIEGWNLFQLACLKMNVPEAKAVFTAFKNIGITLNHTDKRANPFTIAAYYGKELVLAALLEVFGTDKINDYNEDGLAPIHYAAMHKKGKNALAYMLALSCVEHTKPIKGTSKNALHIACDFCAQDCVDVLIKAKKFNLSAEDDTGYTCFDYAKFPLQGTWAYAIEAPERGDLLTFLKPYQKIAESSKKMGNKDKSSSNNAQPAKMDTSKR